MVRFTQPRWEVPVDQWPKIEKVLQAFYPDVYNATMTNDDAPIELVNHFQDEFEAWKLAGRYPIPFVESYVVNK